MRDPYPFPRLENDDDFSSGKQKQYVPHQTYDEKKSSVVPQTQPSWNRLYETKTLASKRREVFHHDPQAPHDYLDFAINSTYDHHQEFLKSTAETLYQPETLGLPHGRILKNRSEPVPKKLEGKKNIPKVSVGDKRESIHSCNGAIPSHHSAATNRGYSRKHDGGFYTC